VKIFVDTNVVVSALATRGLCADLFRAILAEHELLLGETVLGEVQSVLKRKFRVPRETRDELEAQLRGQATVLRAREGLRIKGLDKADSAVVAEAVAGEAEVLVSGDQNLLKLTEPPVRIVSPRGLWDTLRRAT
jgi:putative PIN family toxin of toxin-antitoxin system